MPLSRSIRQLRSHRNSGLRIPGVLQMGGAPTHGGLRTLATRATLSPFASSRADCISPSLSRPNLFAGD